MTSTTRRTTTDGLPLSFDSGQDELAEFNSEIRTATASRTDNESAPDRFLCPAQ